MMRFWKILIYCINIYLDALREQYMLPKTCGIKRIYHVPTAVFTDHRGIVNNCAIIYDSLERHGLPNS